MPEPTEDKFVGLQNSKQDGVVPDWNDITAVAQKFSLREDEAKVYPSSGLGRVIFRICQDRSNSQDTCTRLVAIELAKALNGMLQKGAYRQGACT